MFALIIVSVYFAIIVSIAPFMVSSRKAKQNKRTLEMLYKFTLQDETATLDELIEFSKEHSVQYKM